jgi:hypothetical protein
MLPEKLNCATDVEIDEDEAQDGKMRSVLEAEINLVEDGVSQQEKCTNATPPPNPVS